MSLKVEGLHHFTAIAGDPTENARFYVKVLGMRMVKKTVNHDAPDMYHLFYGDGEGTPGSSITFFPGMAAQKGVSGAGMVTELGLRIPEGSLEYWKERLNEEDVTVNEEEWHGRDTLKFEDPDGLSLRLVTEENDDYVPWTESSVPEENQIRGMHHVTLSVMNEERIQPVLEEMGLERDDLYRMRDGSCIEVRETDKRARMGSGSVHHVAFKGGKKEEIEKWRKKLKRMGMRPSPAISRKYFTSTYARTPVGILFEFSSMEPGYTADEPVEELGENFVLPEKLEGRREEILGRLPELREDEFR